MKKINEAIARINEVKATRMTVRFHDPVFVLEIGKNILHIGNEKETLKHLESVRVALIDILNK